MNLVVLKGNVTRDIEPRFTPNGTKYGSFGLAMNRKWKDKSTGEPRERVIFVDVQVWKDTVDFVQKYFPKGAPMLVTGSLEMDQWEDKETGKKRQRLYVRPDQIEFCGQKRDQPQQASPQRAQSSQSTEEPGELEEENIPF